MTSVSLLWFSYYNVIAGDFTNAIFFGHGDLLLITIDTSQILNFISVFLHITSHLTCLKS
jgi:hypothetical protein